MSDETVAATLMSCPQHQQLTPPLIRGTCTTLLVTQPRRLDAQDRLVQEAGAEAILCLQSSLCHEALQIDWPAIRERALERGVVITCVAVRDFDHYDQVGRHGI